MVAQACFLGGHILVATLEKPWSDSRTARFESWVAGFRTVFHRSDQFLRFRAYLRGLLDCEDRRNIEAIAAAAAKVITVEADLAQALQHFISQSPWDADRLLSALRERSRPRREDPHAVWVLHDGIIPKKGRHSIGVQRQFARSLGVKINCQAAVVLAQAGPKGYFPLAMKLYLPSQWREEAEPGLSKLDIAWQLLDQLQAEGETPLPLNVEEGYLLASDFAEGSAKRNLVLTGGEDGLREALRGFEAIKNLGLDHFEGRSWLGWHHHAALVLAAQEFLASSNGFASTDFAG